MIFSGFCLLRRLLSFAIVSFCLFAPAAAQDDDVISVDSTMVVVNATVLDAAGKAVRSLRREQFKLFEDGKEQSINVFAAEEIPFAAVILIDTSGSMEERVTLARSAAIKFLEGLRTDDAAAIFKFDSTVDQVQEFSNTRDILSDKLYDLKSRGMTTLNDAIYRAAAALAQRAEKRRAIVVLSDGMDTMSKYSSDKALKAALAVGATIFTVDMSAADVSNVQRKQNQGILKKFAEKTGGTFVATPGGTSMREAFTSIVDELGTQYTLGYQPAASRDGRWHEIEVRVSKPNLTIRARKGYDAEKTK